MPQTFKEKLCMKLSISPATASLHILEYKKFLLMMACLAQPLTPSNKVDQVWHLHISFLDHYHIHCAELFKAPCSGFLHHNPTKGGND